MFSVKTKNQLFSLDPWMRSLFFLKLGFYFEVIKRYVGVYNDSIMPNCKGRGKPGLDLFGN